MSVRCRSFIVDGFNSVVYYDYPSGSPVSGGRVDGGCMAHAVCEFLSSLKPENVVAVCEGVSQYGVKFVSVYYRKDD